MQLISALNNEQEHEERSTIKEQIAVERVGKRRKMESKRES